MKKAILFLICLFAVIVLVLTACSNLNLSEPNPDYIPVFFSDPNLEAVVRDKIGKPTEHVYLSDCKAIKYLAASLSNRTVTIMDLTGIEYCTNLAYIVFQGRRTYDINVNKGISDISALSGLINLKQLFLGTNNISDISTLNGLTNLTYLNLRFNSINDISALNGLTNLTYLDLDFNSISDISALSGLTNLTYLDLGDNNISDISVLNGLTNLTYLYLGYNNISDITALVDNSDAGGLGSGDYVNLANNPLSTRAIDVDIPYLQAKGVTVYY
ncbi:MAG: leucine-rich repeat domain-containing protein [Candidatus Goldiibacteriota bacterium]